jgi:serine/threonine protein kinase
LNKENILDVTSTEQKLLLENLHTNSNQEDIILLNKTKWKSKASNTLAQLIWTRSLWISRGQKRKCQNLLWIMVKKKKKSNNCTVLLYSYSYSSLLSHVNLELSKRLELLDFMKRILCFDPDERLTAQEALLHPFISQHHQHSQPSYNRKTANPATSTKNQSSTSMPLSKKASHVVNCGIRRTSKESKNYCPNL